MTKIKAVLFDMDGVIFDTEKAYLDVWTKVFSDYGYEMTKDIYVSVMGRGRKMVKEIFKKEFGQALPIEEMYIKKDILLNEIIHSNRVTLKEGAIEILDFLRENKYKIALATSGKMDRVDFQLTAKNIKNKFDFIITRDSITNCKPDPEIFLKAANGLQCMNNECIVIEDSSAGIRAAHNAGIISFHVEDLKKADDEIKSMAHKTFKSLLEIKEYIKEELC